MSSAPAILILHASGTNRDGEAARACLLAGGSPEIVHINQLRRGDRRFRDYQMLLLPGGFSYGDALGAGVRLALDMQIFFHDQLHRFVDSGKLVLGICNGFQALVKAGLLPGAMSNAVSSVTEPEPGDGPRNVSHATRRSVREISDRAVTLTENESGHFECRWVYLAADHQVRATFLHEIRDLIFCPIAHAEGNFQVRDRDTLQRLRNEKLIAFRYVRDDGRPADGHYPWNPNGSVFDIAGICNARGNVVGLMPHPEDHISPIQNPLGGNGQLGMTLFKAMVRAARL
jgi:phosphoribosylformylglycinamidine synthase